jgi:uncharacterized membrane protein YraQ (UPF0718 family)
MACCAHAGAPAHGENVMNVLTRPGPSRREALTLVALIAAFVGVCLIPVDAPRFQNAIHSGFSLLQWYAREHVILCLLPAFLIAGAIPVFVSQNAILRLLGPTANKVTAYSTASVSGGILAVCSCTVLPLFGGIYRRGAGLGPAIAFLYSGPAINVLAIIMTARILGFEIGTARAIGAIVFSVVIGLLMHAIFLREERARTASAAGFATADEPNPRPIWEPALVVILLIAILIAANWTTASNLASPLGRAIAAHKWEVTAALAVALAALLTIRRNWSIKWLAATALVVAVIATWLPQHPDIAFAAGLVGFATQAFTMGGEEREWMEQSWDFTKKILPLLFGGVFVAGFLLGQPGSEGLIPGGWVSASVGGNGFLATAGASLIGGLMYFATLTEIPVVQGLLGAGMGKGPALALLLAGPAVSLPNLLVIRSLIGQTKTLAYVGLVVVMATISGLIYGYFFA